ncbi:MAG: hypothetical protein C0617_03130 [Desulfuromonas sp.]|uniref:DUF6962 family protein n=1 Tax=Desulfuromonas sp. TaxID=892 RepID=UPI000CB658B6|nr:hypothetical protein [Desulfuromonas sp.]PLX85689.1 MAG: hypothetical protein C0617_03130 [Desulfuromonas sp.]
MTIHEPMTLATDLLLAALVLWFAARLFREARDGGQRSVLLWGAAFVASALAAAAGGVVHGFTDQLGPLQGGLWKVTVYSVGLASLLLVSASSYAAARGAGRALLIALALAKFVFYAVWMAGHDAFRYVIYDYAPALLLVLILMGWGAARRSVPGALWVVGGILVSFGAAAIQMKGPDLHLHFNHNDLYHVVQMGGFWLWYRGGLLLRDR